MSGILPANQCEDVQTKKEPAGRLPGELQRLAFESGPETNPSARRPSVSPHREALAWHRKERFGIFTRS
jgi:hypothetical protein